MRVLGRLAADPRRAAAPDTDEEWAHSGARALLSGARALHVAADRLEERARRMTDPAAVTHRSWLDVLHGDWPALQATAARGLEQRSVCDEALEEVTLALTSALLGDVSRARMVLVVAEGRAEPCGALAVGRALTRAVIWFERAQPDAATEVLLEVLALAEQHGVAQHWLPDVAGLLAESAARCERLTEVRPVLAAVDPLDPALTRAAREESGLGAALAAPDPLPAIDAFVESSGARSSFVLGRAHLRAGMLQRRRRHLAAARHRLQVASDLLVACGADAWSRVASNELRIAGVAGAPRGTVLTEQQRAIAELAARGMSNQQIALELYLSPRTVGSHLYRLFPKLGITSRRELTPELMQRW